MQITTANGVSITNCTVTGILRPLAFHLPKNKNSQWNIAITTPTTGGYFYYQKIKILSGILLLLKNANAQWGIAITKNANAQRGKK